MVSPRSGLNGEVAYRVAHHQVDYVDRKFEPSDLDDVDMVLAAVDDAEASSRIYTLCKERRIPANIADVPPECDFYFGSVHRDGPLQIMVSTNGNGPKLASIVRKEIAAHLPKNTGAAIAKMGLLRRKLRQIVPAPEEGPKRMKWYVFSLSAEEVSVSLIFRLSKVCESYTLDELCQMNEADMERLLEFFRSGKVPKLEELREKDDSEYSLFDGSFGWW